MKKPFLTVPILGIPFISTTMKELTAHLEKHVFIDRQPAYIVTANPEIVMHTRKDAVYKKSVLQADYIIADGIGVVIGSKIMKQPLPERVAGFDLLQELLLLSDQYTKKIFLYGGAPGVVDTVKEKIEARYPGIQIVGAAHGFNQDEEALVQKMIGASPDLIFAATGFPRQENFLARHAHHFPHALLMGVGGSFDVIAEKAKRAPQLFIRLNLEWFYRLLMQPTRLVRMLVLPQFLITVLRKK